MAMSTPPPAMSTNAEEAPAEQARLTGRQLAEVVGTPVAGVDEPKVHANRTVTWDHRKLRAPPGSGTQ